jgi:subtilisin family serine protease
MLKLHRAILVIAIAMLVTCCTAPVTEPPASPTTSQSAPPATSQSTPVILSETHIARHPAPDNYSYMNTYTELPVYDPHSTDLFQVDIRSSNLTKLDLTESRVSLLHGIFDSKTQWPTTSMMPVDFDWQRIMETGKNPGLGIHALHTQGITGKGINIAIIDQPLIVQHAEYGDQIRLYEEINISPATPSQMHGPAVASIAVGKSVGVAPDSNLYYIATWVFDPSSQGMDINYKYYAQAIHHIIEINKGLPRDQKIQAISMSIGLSPKDTGYDEIISAIKDAKQTGIFAMTVYLDQTYGWNIMGLGREPLSDPDNFQSYGPASWWEQIFFEGGFSRDTLLIPMDSRTTASPTGEEDYVFYAHGGMSWTVPYLAGVYALAAQVKPEITPDEFWEAALDTGRTIQIQHDGKEYEFGIILDPQALIEEIQSR